MIRWGSPSADAIEPAVSDSSSPPGIARVKAGMPGRVSAASAAMSRESSPPDRKTPISRSDRHRRCTLVRIAARVSSSCPHGAAISGVESFCGIEGDHHLRRLIRPFATEISTSPPGATCSTPGRIERGHGTVPFARNQWRA